VLLTPNLPLPYPKQILIANSQIYPPLTCSPNITLSALRKKSLGYRLDDPGFLSQHGKRLFSFVNIPTGSSTHPASYSMVTADLSAGMQR
jgi:hypothetical protein